MAGAGPGEVLFRAAAGARLGFGHLVRCRSLARALGVDPVVSLRGTRHAAAAARRLGVQLTDSNGRALRRSRRLRLLVVDDPSAAHAAVWVRRARRLRIPVAALNDLGLGYVPSDLGVDGSIRPRSSMQGRCGDLRGTRYSVLDPLVPHWRREHRSVVAADQVLIALGGGAHVLSLAVRIAHAIRTRNPQARIRIARGFSTGRSPQVPAGEWIEVRDGLAEALARSTVAVLAGGVSLYEACAIGVPSVALALTTAQGLAIRGLASAGATIDAGSVRHLAHASDRIAAGVARLLTRNHERARMAAAGRRLVDGRGAQRVADCLNARLLSQTERCRAA